MIVPKTSLNRLQNFAGGLTTLPKHWKCQRVDLRWHLVAKAFSLIRLLQIVIMVVCCVKESTAKVFKRILVYSKSCQRVRNILVYVLLRPGVKTTKKFKISTF